VLLLVPTSLASAATAGGAAYAGGATEPAAVEPKTPAARKLGDRTPLRSGMHGADVRALQQLLVTVGERVGVDGAYGPATARALRAFERGAGLPADGTLSAADLAALRDAPSAPAPPEPTLPPAPPATATIGADGLAVAPAGAPVAVAAVIAAGNKIARLPYRYGGGHRSFDDTGYDCSGSLSYALHGAGLLDTTLDSTGLESFGEDGAGKWITIYANAGHTFMIVAGIRFDTSGQQQADTRWQPAARSVKGYVVRHPAGL
jgi:peptidoglycan hydrolase-like protein with peptidoglycan-binding domain